MSRRTKLACVMGSAALAVCFAATGAMADGSSGGGSVKDAPKDEGRKLTWSWNIGATSDYVFRGVSQSAERPAFQLGADASYGILYAGFWGSSIDFGNYTERPSGDLRQVGGFAEIDYYMGIKPVLGPLNFDLGVIYYTYAGAKDGNFILTGKPYEFDYVELKAGYSTSAFIKNLTTGTTLFWSPDYTNRQGSVLTVESTAAYELPKVAMFVPTISGTLGSQYGDFDRTKFAAGLPTYFQGNGKDGYMYWNAGLSLAFDKLTLDFRYWDTNIKNFNTTTGIIDFCDGQTTVKAFQCDGRFVGSAKITF